MQTKSRQNPQEANRDGSAGLDSFVRSDTVRKIVLALLSASAGINSLSGLYNIREGNGWLAFLSFLLAVAVGVFAVVLIASDWRKG